MATDKEIRKLAWDVGARVRKYKDTPTLGVAHIFGNGPWRVEVTINLSHGATDAEAVHILKELKDPIERLKVLAKALDVEINKRAGVS